MTFSTLLEPLRRPEYTGENRCLPCTLLNLALVVLAAAFAGTRHRLAGALTLGAGVSLVALRGYVVPGTPWFAPRLVEALGIDFDHPDPPGDPLVDADAPPDSLGADLDPAEILQALLAAGVVAEDGPDLVLDEEFRAEWQRRMAELRTAADEELLDRVAAACPQDVEGHRHDDRILLAGDRDIRTSRPVAIAETAAIETLASYDVPEPVRAPAATPLRTFLERCPRCGSRVEETTIQNCCGGPGSAYANPEQPVLACEDCEAVVVEL